MENLLTLTLEAHNAERNHHRRYEIVVGRDLLDYWTVTIRNGRIGCIGQESRFASLRPDYLKSIIRDRLQRRLSAPRRIGCQYQVVEFATRIGFDWVPAEMMQSFTRC